MMTFQQLFPELRAAATALASPIRHVADTYVVPVAYSMDAADAVHRMQLELRAFVPAAFHVPQSLIDTLLDRLPADPHLRRATLCEVVAFFHVLNNSGMRHALSDLSLSSLA